jgi:hypothetical protein
LNGHADFFSPAQPVRNAAIARIKTHFIPVRMIMSLPFACLSIGFDYLVVVPAKAGIQTFPE